MEEGATIKNVDWIRRVEQVLINLINNAIKFTERGEVSVECQIKNGWLETSVRDTAMGIKGEDLPRLFKPFQQIHMGLEGTGLGLAICKRLVLAMHGRKSMGRREHVPFTLPISAGIERQTAELP